MTLFIIEKKGRKLNGRTVQRSIPTLGDQKQKVHRLVPVGTEGVAWKAVAIVTALSPALEQVLSLSQAL